MAAISLIAGSVLGWLAAAVALLAGTLLSTAFLVFVVTSLVCAVAFIALAQGRSQNQLHRHRT